MADVVRLPEVDDKTFENKNMSFNSKLIDALLDVRLTLSIKKISSNVILKSEFKSVLDSVKDSTKDQMVSDALDDVFGEYFKKKETNVLSITDVEKTVEDNIDYGDEKAQVGISLVKTDKHYKPTLDSENHAA